MRICVVGGGLAGMLLAWRLVRQPRLQVTLVTGAPGVRDSTGVSGGLVRGFETDPQVAELAARSLQELRASALLREWSEYQETGSLYLLHSAPPLRRLIDVDRSLPGSVLILDRAELAARYGFSGLPEQAAAVLERHAGHFSPDALRRGARADFAARGGVVDTTDLCELDLPASGEVRYRTGAVRGEADLLVLATGAWTGRLLTGLGLPAPDLRTKVIQCAVYAMEGNPPPPFVDETSGLYGRPAGPGRILLGLPTDRWDTDPGQRIFLDREERAVRRTAALRLPGLALNPPHRFIAMSEAYATEGRLALRAALHRPSGLFTFTGGSGAAAKTALAASSAAAADLLAPIPITEGERS
ncbi:FAD-dependent oxidoreductase [Streptomyces sp. H10-C2]|uniref:NAD(P)/FAD-dependent oxidoreductase n=1 Tax=unclassified Streptomyces TaxID=2593676 RepID=UPI0024BAD6C4|nr:MULTISPECIES: FAD-dependent oxidoreductase [unclassified Streptomyces]MDJ0346004.1 FAD-dependent oxidoreductase [Streptomyces sp. PH10-H1]MDJ0370489.1 FAD-dependent oxidoreductase [Streptomyces sp. H10-C2]